ncbi:cysteine hydrolase [Pseudooceanicola sp. CBS1P-1]|uniref:Isochorismatase family protein n=1 Tax=Pseudooceanicola albus TaxID=2692189 RepID=A0A6L7G6F0_9RHOB|nr:MULTISPECIES: cysteine hydrolase [Pseudooceanicola]MBT9385928.1 cysteine hydrolase [Pseudooceanicola endophyticus]MXN19651.1 isochorismatase family protein [Pseudooceanicola albus]
MTPADPSGTGGPQAGPVPGLYPWPFDGDLRPDNTALLVIGMQRDYLCAGGWLDCAGHDIAPLAALSAPLGSTLSALRRAGLAVLHLREGHRPDLNDLPETKRWRSARMGAEIGHPGPLGRHLVRGAPGTDLVLPALPGEDIIEVTGRSGFYGTDLDALLRLRGLRNLVLAGALTDGMVQATLREANDRGYECLVLEDLCASTSPAQHAEQIRMFALAGGLWGSVGRSADLLAALEDPR